MAKTDINSLNKRTGNASVLSSNSSLSSVP